MEKALQYTWIKFRTLHSSGPDLWDYREMEHFGEVLMEALEQEWAEQLNDELSTHSEYWRGVEVEIAVPPSEFLEIHRKRLEFEIKSLQEALARVERMTNA
jgi:hypothetical protein